MSMCTSYGRPKVKHATKSKAALHAHKLNKQRIYKSEAYKCRCGFWHAGRIPVAKQRRMLEAYEKAINERLVGKLIAALKATINGNDMLATSYKPGRGYSDAPEAELSRREDRREEYE